jgi:molecular chaperone HtpG
MTIATQKETLGFQAEVKQILHLMIHSLYSNKEIFLRELISNASDAADKLRFCALSDASLMENNADIKIGIEFNKEARTITLTDNGIGMSREEVITHLGTIAKSGTKEFLQNLTGDQSKDAHLIGQFGVGFYSSFIVADKVTVLTRKAGLSTEQGVKWESSGEGDYIIENYEKPERGTQVILHLKQNEEEFLDEWRIRHIVTKYSDHILIPIELKTQVEKEGKKEDKVEVINKATALWTLPKNEVKEEDYKEFYKHISHDFQDPLLWVHNKVEGKQEYITLLYVPSHAPFDLYHPERSRGLKLYVKRVFIMDDAEQFLPFYLRFVRGVIDSADLPLNVSREILQNNLLVENIKSSCTKRILNTLETLAIEDKAKYQQFWKNFGQVLKEGPAHDPINKEQIGKLLRFSSTHTDSEEQNVSLDDYISRMKPEQDKIYYITAENFSNAKTSPHLELFRKKNIEVLLLCDRIDEWLTTHFDEYQGKKLQSVAQGNIDLGKLEDEEDKKQLQEVEKNYEGMINQIKEVLKENVKEVRLTSRLTSSPACVVSDDNEMGIQMQRMFKASGQNVPVSKPIFELNPTHGLIQKLREEQDDDRFKNLTWVLFDQAMLAEHNQLSNAGEFVSRLNKLLMGV